MDEDEINAIQEEMARISGVASNVVNLAFELAHKFRVQVEQVLVSSSKDYWDNQLRSFKSLKEDEIDDSLMFFNCLVEWTNYGQDVAVVT